VTLRLNQWISRCRQIALVAIMAAGLLTVPQAFAQQTSLVGVDAVRFEPLSQTVPVIGRLISLNSGDVAARVAGPVESVEVRVGDRVTKGQVIAVLDAETLKADRDLAQSEFAEAQAEHQTWVAELELAKTDLRRQQGLRKSSAFSQARFEDAEKKVTVAAAKVARAVANTAIKNAALKRKSIDVSYAEIRAPFDGVVVRRHTDVGTFVDRGEDVVSIIGDTNLEVEAEVPSRRLSGLEAGRSLRVILDDGSKHMANVRAILPSENPLTRTRTVRFKAQFDGSDRQLAHSQSVRIEIPISADRRVLTVHKDAILKRQGSDLVYVVSKGVAEPRTITLGEAIGNRMEVTDGLKAGDEVVVRGNERLQPGATVRIGKGSS
jgi:RND family efflux transporter MFP subunit